MQESEQSFASAPPLPQPTTFGNGPPGYATYPTLPQLTQLKQFIETQAKSINTQQTGFETAPNGTFSGSTIPGSFFHLSSKGAEQPTGVVSEQPNETQPQQIVNYEVLYYAPVNSKLIHREFINCCEDCCEDICENCCLNCCLDCSRITNSLFGQSSKAANETYTSMTTAP